MGTRFLLTEESTVPDSVKEYYLSKSVTDTIVTTKVDGVPHRVLRTPLVEELDRGSAFTRYPRAVKNAFAFKKLTGTSWSTLARDGIAMKKGHELGWDQVIMAANTPMLLKAALVDGHVDSGVMSSGQVVGLIDALPAAGEVVRTVIAEAEAVLTKLGEV
jgi:NAD(P)H-dependent flavin oxidoreductase YrpB (nitropropane dioxygenase family)